MSERLDDLALQVEVEDLRARLAAVEAERDGTRKMNGRAIVLEQVSVERDRQEGRFPEQHLPDGTAVGAHPPQVHLKDALNRERRAKEQVEYAMEHGGLTWSDVLEEEVAEALAAIEAEDLRTELVQVAAVVVRWIEDIDRRSR